MHGKWEGKKGSNGKWGLEEVVNSVRGSGQRHHGKGRLRGWGGLGGSGNKDR